MDKRLAPLLIAAMAVVALVIALLDMTHPASAGAADSTSGSTSGSSSRIVMTGSADAHLVPDQLGFELLAQAEDKDLSTALTQANDAMRGAMDTLRRRGVDAKDIASSGLDMSPVYDYSGKHQTLRGYQVTQQAQVTVHDLGKAGGLIGAVVAGGGNAVQVQGIQLSVSDPDAALGSARREAVQRATAKASQYAEAAGRSLGAVVCIVEPSASSTPLPLLSGATAASTAASGEVPISAGDQTMTVEVTMTWSLG